METARRYKDGKIRYELIPNSVKKELAKVYTIGAEKYSDKDKDGNIIYDGSDNWRLGLPWMQCLSSAMRHLEKFQGGEDYDNDYPLELLEKYGPTLHLANAIWNLGTIIEYMRIHPEMDNRQHHKRVLPKIGLDIDEVICNWVEPWSQKFGYPLPEDWHFSYDQTKHFKEDMTEKELNDFYSKLPAKIKPSDIPFPIECYITSRSVPTELTKKWIQDHGFPTRPVYSLGLGVSKVETAQKAGIDWFVDDNYQTYLEMNKAGILCFLLTANHNKKYEIGYKRINSLKELKERFL